MNNNNKIPKTKRRDTCRVCGSNKLSELFSLGNQYINNFVSKDDIYNGVKAPLELVFCEVCTLVQLRHTAPQELLYKRYYWYKSGITKTMRKALLGISSQIEERFNIKKGDIVLDIGSNDGTLLRSYKTQGIITVGVEPADNLLLEGKIGLTYHIHDFWNYKTYIDRIKKKAKVITAIGMFYDMEDPNQFIYDAGKALTDDGVFIAQLMCLKNMIDSNDVGNICHEHLEYYSFDSLEYLFNKNGLDIFDIELNDVNGGSYRVFAKLMDNPREQTNQEMERIDAVRLSEEKLSNKETFKKFFNRLELNKKKCFDFINKAVKNGKSVWVYGASTKGNVILQYYGIDKNLIEYASERSSWKWNKYTIGTGIKCLAEDDARKANPDYFLVLPYAFFNEMYSREKKWRSQGGKFILPLPEFRVIE